MTDVNLHVYPCLHRKKREESGLLEGNSSEYRYSVSVVVPVYNVSDYLAQCLESILGQRSKQIEIIGVNDGSTDGSLGILKSFAQSDSRVKIIDKPNGGYGSAVNRGIDAAAGGYVSIIEPDDYIVGAMHEDLYAAACSNGFPDVVKTPFVRVVEGDGGSTSLKCGFWGRIKPGANPFAIGDAPLLLRYHPSIWSAIYKVDFLRKKGIRFEERPGGGWVDNPFMVRTLCEAASILYSERAYYHYREQREGSSSSSIADYRMPIDRWNEMTDFLEGSKAGNEAIYDIHYYRGFHYLNDSRNARNFLEDSWREDASAMLLRMDPAVVARGRYISPSDKALFCELTGKELSDRSDMPYYRMLLAETYWEARNNGIGGMLRKARSLRK